MQNEPLPLDIDTNLPSYLAECRQRLEDTLTTVAAKARDKTLPDVTLADGELRISPLRKNTPESAEAFAEKAYALMPHVPKIPLQPLQPLRDIDSVELSPPPRRRHPTET